MFGWVAAWGAAPLSDGPAVQALTAIAISASRTMARMTPNGRFLVNPDRKAAKSMSSIITTNRNRTATAPT